MKFNRFCASHEAMLVQQPIIGEWFAQKWANAQAIQVVTMVPQRPRASAGED